MLANGPTDSSAIRPSNFTIAILVEVRLVEILNISIQTRRALCIAFGLFSTLQRSWRTSSKSTLTATLANSAVADGPQLLRESADGA